MLDDVKFSVCDAIKKMPEVPVTYDSKFKGERRGGVVRLSELEPHTNLRGHPGLSAYRFVRPPSELCQWLLVTLDVVEHGGGIEPHVHTGIEADHAYYIVEGEVNATIGDELHEAGPDSLLIFPCDVTHGLKVTSKSGARLLRLGASPSGRATGGSVFLPEWGSSTPAG